MADNNKPKPTAKPAPKGPGGRPRKIISQADFEKLCLLQCTQEEICGWFGITDKTLASWCRRTYQDEDGKPMGFSEAYKVYSKDGKISIRRLQFKHAEKSAAMAMYLGKIYLGQREDADVHGTSQQAGPPLVINYNYGDGEPGGKK